MTIRDHVRRALRKSSASSRSNGTAATASPVSSNTSQSSESSSSLHKTTSMLSRAFTWGGREKDDGCKNQKKHSKNGKRVTHPSEKPLTAENLKHQELLSHFTMTFGASDPSRLDSMSFFGVSPCCTRRPSIDGDFTTSTEASSRCDLSRAYDSEMVPP
ncbi:hypothetical protein S40285_00243 [Stachybotrys chlorohalonatus IBT 40285]|uniref:Uncharacterized protein n=1 Tax=Stachybotrys chlorohalonatus (strain IBT 40285) TaxID=1283841 RepID=A0A084QU05_STAC4|nr:hypothetical protein S40285_00243 [Stachybotrys chlorohalonata IBT 40285]